MYIYIHTNVYTNVLYTYVCIWRYNFCIHISNYCSLNVLIVLGNLRREHFSVSTTKPQVRCKESLIAFKNEFP